MLRIGICDDAAAARLALRSALERLLPGCLPYEFSSGDGLLSWLDKHPNTMDLVFLDIEMDGTSGMDTARTIRARDSRLLIVFVTGYPDYVFDGYTVRALDYLLKPIQIDKLACVLARAQEQLADDAPEIFTLRNTGGIFRVPKREILYFYSDRRLVHLITAHADYTFYDKLDHTAQLAGPDFVRIHQRYLVRIDAIDRIDANQVLIGSTRLPVSRANRAAVLEACARGLLEES